MGSIVLYEMRRVEFGKQTASGSISIEKPKSASHEYVMVNT